MAGKSRKIRDIVAKTGEYIDHSGHKKGRYTNAGSLFYNDEEKSFFILLNRTFNPAGVPLTDRGEADSVLLSCFNPERKDGNSNNGGNSQSGYSGGNNSSQSANSHASASGHYSGNTATQTSHQRPLDDEDVITF